jgi:predicted Zn-dependent protease
MANFFQTIDRLQKQSGQEVPTFLSTHPDPVNRERKVEKEATKWKRKLSAAELKVNRDSYLRMIDGIIYGEDPKQGFIEHNVFYHPDLRFQFPIPTQWQVQNTPQAVQMAEPNGRAMMLMTLAQGSSLEQAAQQIVQQYQLRVVDSRATSVNGLQAAALIADQQQQNSEAAVRTLIYLIQYGSNIYAMIGASSLADFNGFAPLFQNTMGGFSVLTDPEKINRKPERIRIKEVPQTGTLQQALQSLRAKESDMQELSVLNGMKLTDRVERGMLIKTIE